MAKAAKKKSKRKAEISELTSAKAQRKIEREIRDFIDGLDEASIERQEYVDAILKANKDNEEISKAIAVMVDVLKRMHGAPTITYNGYTYNTIGEEEDEKLKRIQERNFNYLSIRVLVACAEWDIQIGGFKLPANACARCATPVKKGKKKSKVKKKRG